MKWVCGFVGSLMLGMIFVPLQAQTTVILLRHAEKVVDGGNDPVLSEKGAERALELARVLAHVQVDAIYATPFNRTRQTVLPLAESKRLDILEYNPFKLEDIARMLKSADNKTFVFSGHSNTTPILVNLLTGSENYKALDEADYDNLYIVTLNGDETFKVLELAYGDASEF